jgi:hypothetical protein
MAVELRRAHSHPKVGKFPVGVEDKVDISSHKRVITMAALQGDAAVVRRVNMTAEERRECFTLLLSMLDGKHLKRGSFSIVTPRFSVQVKTVARLWNILLKKLLINIPNVDIVPERTYYQSGRKGNSGRLKLHGFDALAL